MEYFVWACGIAFGVDVIGRIYELGSGNITPKTHRTNAWNLLGNGCMFVWAVAVLARSQS